MTEANETSSEEELVRKIAQEGPDFLTGLQRGDERGMTLLHWSARLGYCQLTLALIRSGADIDATDYSEATPLMHAAYAGHHEVLRTLLTNGADPRISNEFEKTVWTLACTQDCVQVLVVLSHDSNCLEILDESSVAKAAVACGATSCLRFLKSFIPGFHRSIQLPGGETLKDLAVACHQDKVVSLLEEWDSGDCAPMDTLTISNTSSPLRKTKLLSPLLWKTILEKVSPRKSKVRPERKRISRLLVILEKHKLACYSTNFENHMITFSEFITMTDQDLLDIGITKDQVRKKFTKIIKYYKTIFDDSIF